MTVSTWVVTNEEPSSGALPTPVPVDITVALAVAVDRAAASAAASAIAVAAAARAEAVVLGDVTWDDIAEKPAAYPPQSHAHETSDIAGLISALGDKVGSASIGAASGVAPLGANAKVPAAYLPSYVDDVVDVDDYASLPETGETGKIYVDLETRRTWRWSGTAYAEISAPPASTDAVPEGSANLYHTAARAAAAAPVQSVAGRAGAVTLTKADVGLSSVDNTADAEKPVSTAQAGAISAARASYASRAAAAGATVSAAVHKISVATPSGFVVDYVRSAAASALTTGDGATWAPADIITPDHFAENTTPGTTNMAAAVASALSYAATRAGTPAGVHQNPAIAVDFFAETYLISSRVSIPSTMGAVHLRGNGALIKTASTSSLFRFGDDAVFDNVDAAGAGTPYGHKISGFTFRNANYTAASSVAIEIGYCWGSSISDNQFFDFSVSIDVHACGRLFIERNQIYIRNRTVATTAGVRIVGVYDSTNNYTPSGWITYRGNNISGKPADQTNLEVAVLIKCCDGFFYGDNHCSHYACGLKVDPEGSTSNYKNNVITEIVSEGGNYFDDPGTAAKNVFITGTVASSGTSGQAAGIYGNIRFSSEDYFRGAGAADYGVVISVTDGGGFATAYGGVKGIDLRGYYSHHRSLAITAAGANSSKLEAIGLSLTGIHFSKGLYSAGPVSCASIEAQSATVRGCRVEAELNAPSYAFSCNLSGSATVETVFAFSDNDLSGSTYTTDMLLLSTDVQARVDVSNNISAAPFGRFVQQRVSAYTVNNDASVVFSYFVPSIRIMLSVRARLAGHTDNASDLYSVYDIDAVFRKNNAGTTSMISRTDTRATTNFTANLRPVQVTLMTGAAWSSGMSVALGDVVVSSGNAYMATISDGAAGTTAPTHTSGAVADGGGVTWMYLGAQAASTVAVIVSGSGSNAVRWAGTVELIQSI